MLGGKLRDIYEKYGVKSVYPIIYILFLSCKFPVNAGYDLSRH